MKKIIRSIAFLILFVLLFHSLQNNFGVETLDDQHLDHKLAEGLFRAYFQEQENMVDAVYIGNSHVHNFWQPAFAFREYGLAVMNFSSPDLPVVLMKNMAIEASKKQKPKLFIFDLTGFARENIAASTKEKGFLVLSNLSYSANFADAVRRQCDYVGGDWMDKLNYYFPFLAFHTRWKNLSKIDFTHEPNPYLNSAYLKNDFFEGVISKKEHIFSDKSSPIGEVFEKALRELLEWCQSQGMNAEFVIEPVLLNEKKMQMYNYIGQIVKEYGFEFINYNDKGLYEEFGFEEEKDYYDFNHTNIKGSYKYTMLYGKRLIEKYDLEDHRGEERYQSWEERSDAYYRDFGKYLTENE